MSPSGLRLLATVGVASCWGAFVLTWLSGAVYNVSHGPAERTRAPSWLVLVAGLIVAVSLVHLVPAPDWSVWTTRSVLVRVVGLAVLVVSTVFTLWARLTLGTMWSSAPMVKQQHELRTDGPYAVTRHPIYTGILGMLLGTGLLVGIGQWALLVPVGLVVFEVKIHLEEGLMSAAFPAEYARYRERVPQLIPGLRRRRSHSGP
jgi:protein-S-isoprenylcysteine O-methyltransferase Ste14